MKKITPIILLICIAVFASCSKKAEVDNGSEILQSVVEESKSSEITSTVQNVANTSESEQKEEQKKEVTTATDTIEKAKSLPKMKKWEKIVEVDDLGNPTGTVMFHFAGKGNVLIDYNPKGNFDWDWYIDSITGLSTIVLTTETTIEDAQKSAKYTRVGIVTRDDNYITSGSASGVALIENDSLFDVVISEDLRETLASSKEVEVKINVGSTDYELGPIMLSGCEELFFDCESYTLAEQKINSHLYSEAIDSFNALDSRTFNHFKCSERIRECNYLIGKELMSKAEYLEAIKAFKKCGLNYSDTKELVLECKNIVGGEIVEGIGPALGYVFYDKGSYSDGWRYLEVSGCDIGEYKFGYYLPDGETETSVGTLAGVGNGSSNTEAFVVSMGNMAYAYSWRTGSYYLINDNYAARACADYSVTVGNSIYDDWFLPSKEELNLIYKNLSLKGLGFYLNGEYWSSSEESSSYSYGQDLVTGKQEYKSRYDSCYVLPIRAF